MKIEILHKWSILKLDLKKPKKIFFHETTDEASENHKQKNKLWRSRKNKTQKPNNDFHGFKNFMKFMIVNFWGNERSEWPKPTTTSKTKRITNIYSVDYNYTKTFCLILKTTFYWLEKNIFSWTTCVFVWPEHGKILTQKMVHLGSYWNKRFLFGGKQTLLLLLIKLFENCFLRDTKDIFYLFLLIKSRKWLEPAGHRG